MGVLFNGTSQRVDVANQAFFDYERTDPFSVACWFYREPTAAAGGGALLVGKAGPPGWALDQNDFGSGLYIFSLHLINTAGNELWKFSSAPGSGTRSILKGTWNHVAATYDGSSTLAGIKLYLNGVDAGTGGSTNLETLSASILTDEPLAVGGIAAGPEWFDGAIAVPVLSDYVWTASEVAKLADLANIGADLNTLLDAPPQWWARFSDVNDLTDRSGNGNNGTAVGSPTTFAGPSIALDHFGQGPAVATFTGSTSWTHTPHAGPLKCVVVTIKQNTVATDRISGVTYGGVAMTRSGFAQDTVGEPGASYIYTLHDAIPTGAQTVAVTVTAGAEAKKGVSYGLIASAGTRGVTSGLVQGDTANPTVTLSTPASYEGMAFAALFSGLAAPSNITAGNDYVSSGGVDFGSQAGIDESGQVSGANVAVNFTALSDDVAMVAVALEAVLIAAEAGVFAVSGAAATFEVGFAIEASPGVYAVNGAAATVVPERMVAALAGNYAVTGADSSLDNVTSLDAAPDSYTVSGAAATLASGRVIDANDDAFFVTGNVANLFFSGAVDFALDAQTGDFNLAAIPVMFVAPSSLDAGSGAFTVNGSNATLSATIPGVVAYEAEEPGYIADYGRGRIAEPVGRLS